jgi:hypothetical protein
MDAAQMRSLGGLTAKVQLSRDVGGEDRFAAALSADLLALAEKP